MSVLAVFDQLCFRVKEKSAFFLATEPHLSLFCLRRIFELHLRWELNVELLFAVVPSVSSVKLRFGEVAIVIAMMRRLLLLSARSISVPFECVGVKGCLMTPAQFWYRTSVYLSRRFILSRARLT
jgi:hypothetical protein